MVKEHVPQQAEAAVRAFESALAETRTRAARLRQVQLPDIPGPTAQEFAEHAKRPDAPPQLKAAARAVDEGRVTWDDVAAGRFAAAPEIEALVREGGPRFAELWQRGLEEDRRRREETPGAPPVLR